MHVVRVSLYWNDLNNDNAKVHDNFFTVSFDTSHFTCNLIFTSKRKNDGHKKANDSIYVFFIAFKSHG